MNQTKRKKLQNIRFLARAQYRYRGCKYLEIIQRDKTDFKY